VVYGNTVVLRVSRYKPTVASSATYSSKPFVPLSFNWLGAFASVGWFGRMQFLSFLLFAVAACSGPGTR